MDVNVEALRKIYNALGDELSKEIFMNRVMYSISRDLKWVRNLAFTNKRINVFASNILECSKQNEIVIFGAGKRGKNLCEVLNFVPWKCFVDNHPRNTELGGIPIVSYDEFVSNYHGEYIVISSRIYRKEIKAQLARNGIIDNIVDFGEIQEDIMQDQYFDLEYMHPEEEKEIFVDAGCYDARSSVNFARWCKGNAFVYAFEPDLRRKEECIYNLERNKVDYRLISKGLWNDEKLLRFKLSDNMGSLINEEGEETVEVITLDKVVKGKRISFIKMDIEGSELPALTGAKETIIKNRPRLAISVYHKAEDIFLIPELILQYYAGYTFFLRHYSIATTETVLYALPTS